MRFSKTPFLAAILLCISTCVLAQPANDNCATATNLGALPTPQSCTAGPVPTRGIGATLVTNTTNLAATPSSPYLSMTGCQQGNASTSSPSSDVWYQVTLTGSELNVSITGGITQPNFAIWQGSCGSLVGLGCATGTAGSLTTQFTGLLPGVYLIQVSGNNINDRGNFQMTLSNDNNCAACLVNHTLTVSPLPSNGFYQAGTPITFCFRVTGWTQQATNWLHGVEVTFGAGWNLGSLVVSPPTSSCDGTAGTWNWYPGGCTSTATGAVWGNGFYFDRNNDGNPGNNFGDNCSTGSPGIGDWLFCLTVTPKACGSPGFSSDLSLSFNTLADGEAGSWGSIACQNDPDVFFSAQTTCCPEPVTSHTDVLCNGACTGTAMATGQGPTGPWDYTWINMAGNVTIRTQNGVAGPDNITGLCAGSYIVRATNVFDGCTAQDTFIVSEPSALSGTSVLTQVTCFGAANGSIVLINAAGGAGGYQYSLNAGPLQGSGSFTGLAPGIYNLTLQDANACTLVFNNLVITQPTAITATDSTVMGSCVPGNDGEIWITASGGTGIYQYSLDGGPNQVGNSFTAVSGGSHTVVVTDQNGCTDTLTSVVPTAGGILATDSLVQVTCNGGANGEIWVLATGGTPNYQYSINGSLLQAANSFTNLPAGSYAIMVQDQMGCTFNLTSVITEPAALAATDSTVGASCTPGNDGEIWILGTTGGTPGYQYSLNGGPFQAGNSFTGLNGGAFIVTVRDSKGCTLALNTTLASAGNISATDTVIVPTCFAGLDGQIIVTATSNAMPILYSFNGGPYQANDTFPNLQSGIYTIDVRDALGCTITLAVQVNDPPQLLASTVMVPLSCANAHNGQISIVNVTGGRGSYVYQINSSPFQSSNVFTGLAAGNYQVVVYDSLFCSVILPVTVTSPTVISVVTTTAPANCGNADGSASATVSGGSPGYTYLWSDGQTTATASNIAAGSYGLTVTDTRGCTSTRNVTVANIDGPTVAIADSSNVTCAGDSNGTAVVAVTGGTGPYQFVWNTPTSVNNDTITGIPGGVWTVTVTDANSCILIDSVTISEPTVLVALPDSVALTCFGGADGQASVLASGGTIAYFYTWSNGDSSASTSGLTAGLYDVTVTDANGCMVTASISLTDPLPVNAAFNATPAMPAQLQIPNATITCLNMSQNASSYLWTFGDGGSSTDIDPSHSYLTVGDYCITLVARDSAGCADTVQQCSYSVWQEGLEIPNTFTPNNDGRNDFFQIVGIDRFPNNHLSIFNRWGNLVYEKDKYDNAWDGSNIRTGAALPDGAYFYIFKTGVEGQVDILGDVVIFR